MNILILEDEPKAASELRQMLESLPDSVQVVGWVPSVTRALAWFTINPVPDLIIADVHLQDGLSFDVFNQLDIEVPIIFCTAYDEYALAAFASNGIDYLLKPVDPQKLASSIQKLYKIGDQFSRRSTTKQLQQVQTQLLEPYKQSILVHHRNKILPILVDTICYLYLRRNVVYIRTQEGTFSFYQTLNSLAPDLNPVDFYRANRNFLIHRKSIVSIEPLWARKLKVILSPEVDESLIISKAKASDFLRWVEGKPVDNVLD